MPLVFSNYAVTVSVPYFHFCNLYIMNNLIVLCRKFVCVICKDSFQSRRISVSPREISGSDAVQLKLSLFWDVTQHMLLVVYRRFGTTYLSHIQGSSSSVCCFTRKYGIYRVCRKVGKRLPTYSEYA